MTSSTTSLESDSAIVHNHFHYHFHVVICCWWAGPSGVFAIIDVFRAILKTLIPVVKYCLTQSNFSKRNVQHLQNIAAPYSNILDKMSYSFIFSKKLQIGDCTKLTRVYLWLLATELTLQIALPRNKYWKDEYTIKKEMCQSRPKFEIPAIYWKYLNIPNLYDLFRIYLITYVKKKEY